MPRWIHKLIHSIYVILLISVITLLVSCGKGSKNENFSNNEETGKIDANDESANTNIPEEYKVDSPDADLYYKQNSEVISEIDVGESENILTEEETFSELSNRGFTQFPITSSYSIEGEYCMAEEVISTSSTKHPMYETHYVTTNGNIWTIFMINGVIMANPVSYNLQSKLGVQLIVSENETIMSYDSTTNKFFETIPNKAALQVVSVTKINAAILEELTIEEIEKYVY